MPVPVWARPSTSRPARAAGIVSTWTGRGSRKPAAVPVMALCSDALYVTFLEQQYLASKHRLDLTATRIRNITEEDQRVIPAQELSLLERTKRIYQSATDALDVRKRMASLKSAAADVSEYAINLIVVFITETILFPLSFLWLTIQLAKRVASPGFGSKHADP